MSSLASLVYSQNYKLPSGYTVTSRGRNYMRAPKLNSLRSREVNGKRVMTGAALAPNMYQGTRYLNDLKADLVESLIRQIPEGPHCSGLAKLYADWTFYSNPPNTPVKDIGEWRASLGLSATMSKELRQWAYKCCDYIYDRMEMANIRINRMSHSGPPFFCKGVDKVALVYDALNNVNEIVNLCNARDLNRLIKRGWIPLGSEGQRVDLPKLVYRDGRIKQGKKTKVNPAYSKSTWTGEPFSGAKEVDLDFTSSQPDITGRLYAGALRRVMANNISINVIVQIYVAAVQTAFHKIDCLRISHETDILRRAGSRSKVVTYDFGSYDTTNTIEMWSLIYKYLAQKIFKPEFTDFLMMTHNLPILSPSWDTKSETPFLYGKFFQSNLNAGVYSGHAGVPVDGKIPAFIYGTYLVHKYTGLSLEEIAENKSKGVFCLFMSDDGKTAWADQRDADGFVAYVDKLRDEKDIYFDLQWEDYGNFLGTNYVDSAIYYNLMRSISKLINTERDKTNKTNLALGVNEVLRRQAKNPYFPIMLKEIGKFYKAFGHDITNMSATVPVNTAVAEFLEKPDVIFYKYINPGDIPEEIIAMVFTTIEKEYAWYKIKDFVHKDSRFYQPNYRKGGISV